MAWQKRRRKHGDTEILLVCLFIGAFLCLCCCPSAGLL